MPNQDHAELYADELANLYDLPQWEHPSDYAGFNPVGDYVVYSQHRESTILEQVNYCLLLEDLEDLEKEHPQPSHPAPHQHHTDDPQPWVMDFRAGHWAVGWVEYIIVRQDAPLPIQERCMEHLAALADYPVLDDMAYSNAQSEAVSEYLDDMPLWEKVQWLEDVGVEVPQHVKNSDDAFLPDDLEAQVWELLHQSEMFY